MNWVLAKVARRMAGIGLLISFFAGVGAQGILYVDSDAPSGGNGSSWGAAYNSLQDALAAASSGSVQEIRVAAGIYSPDRGINQTPGDRDATFRLLNGVVLKGGYAGRGTPNPNERDPETYPTILSGDLARNDQPNWVNHAENSRHIITAINVDSTTLLDGFTISGGYADGVNQSGGALLIQNGSPTIQSCVITDSLAHLGAGLSLLGGNPLIKNCVISESLAWQGRGGGMYNAGGSHPTLIGCRFISNRAYGISSLGDGGAIFDESNSTVTLIGCHFYNNSAFNNVPSFGYGGAICHIGTGLNVVNTSFYRNSAIAGGAVWVGSGGTFLNSCFSGNTALVGGALYAFTYGANASLTNCVLSRNSADDGGGIYNGYRRVSLSNCILWGNTATSAPSAYKAQIHNSDAGGTARVSYSCVQGIFTPESGEDPPDPADFPGCTEANPLFVDADGPDNLPGTGDDNLHLQANSPCIDSGDNNAVPADIYDLDEDGNTTEPTALDLSGNRRFWDDPNTPDQGRGTPPLVDMGVYEYGSVPPTVPGDVNSDGCVDDIDLIAVLFAFGESGTRPEDLNRDGIVDDADLVLVLFNFGRGC